MNLFHVVRPNPDWKTSRNTGWELLDSARGRKFAEAIMRARWGKFPDARVIDQEEAEVLGIFATDMERT